MRQKYVHALLRSIPKSILYIESEYSTDITNEIKMDYIQEKIKTTLEHLRSCLDYLAHDIYDLCIEPTHGKTSKPIYFPYGKTPNDFNSSLGRNSFGDLKLLNYDIYNALESIQPFRSGSNWLIDLCEQTNQIKHNGFLNQETKNHVDVENGRIKLSGNKNRIVFDNCTVNGKKVNHLEFDHDILVSSDEANKAGLEINTWTSFHFSDIDIIKVLKDSFGNVSNLQKSIYSKLQS